MHNIPEGKKIYLVQPDLSKRHVLNGVQTDTVDFHAQVKGYSELAFTVDRYIILNGKQVESNGYEELQPAMYLYLEDIGYFIMDVPEVNVDGNKEVKNVVAYSAEQEFEFRDWKGIKINCGTSDSIEYSYMDEDNIDEHGFALKYVSMYNPSNTHLSFLHLILEKMSSKWHIQYVSPKLTEGTPESTERIPQYEVNPDQGYQIQVDNLYNIVSRYVTDKRADLLRLLDGYATGKFANIDLNQRQKILWNSTNLDRYSYFARQHNCTEGSYSTVLGSYETYNDYNIAIAYSPLLQTSGEEPEPLSNEIIQYYLHAVIEESLDPDGSVNILKLFDVDKSGFDDKTSPLGFKIKNLVAGAGTLDNAEIINVLSQVMHYRDAEEHEDALEMMANLVNSITAQEEAMVVDHSKLPALDLDNMNLYAIMTSEVAPRMECIFVFDYLNFGIRVYYKDELEFDTDIYVGFRNLTNSVNVSVDSNSIYTRFTVEGDDSLDFRDYNYGDNTITDLSYFLSEPFMEEETAEKYKNYIKFRDMYRNDYNQHAFEYNTLLKTREDKMYAIPSDATTWTNWSNMNRDGLTANLEYYQSELELLQISVDDRPDSEKLDSEGNYVPKKNSNGEVDHEWYEDKLYDRTNRYGGYYTYREIVKYIIPYIEMAIDNLYKIDEDKLKPDTDISEDWEAYGLAHLEGVPNEYEGLLPHYEQELDTLARYSKSWDEMSPEERKIMGLDYIDEGQGEQYEQIDGRVRYKHIKAQIGDEQTPNTIKYQIKKLKDEIAEIDAMLTFHQNITADYAEIMKYNLVEDDLENITHLSGIILAQRRSLLFTERELLAIDTLIRDTDYTNSNILTTSIMSVSEKFDVERELFNDASDKLYEVAQPQFKFSVSTDNFFRLPDYESWAKQFDTGGTDPVPIGLLKFIHVGIRDDYAVKLRVIGYRWNPCDVNPELTLEFSNFITGRSGRSDLTELLELSNNVGAKNSIKIGNGSAESAEEYALAIMDLLKNTSLFKKSVQSIASGVTGGTDVATVQSIIGDYLGNIVINPFSGTIDVRNVIGLDTNYIAGKIADFDTGQFNTVITKYLQANNITATTGSFEELSAKIVQAQEAYIESLRAGDITADSVRTVLLEATRAEIDTLLADDIIADRINAFNVTSTQGVFQSQWAKNFFAQHISVGDLAAGDIVLSDAMKIRSATRSDENDKSSLVMNDRALQFTDKDGNVAIQLGIDASGDPTLFLKDENGNLLLSTSGITQNAIADNIIVNRMIENGTIEKQKLGFEIIEPNEHGGIDITKVYDANGDSFGTVWSSFYDDTVAFMESMDDVGSTVELHGQQVFVEKNGNITPSSITLRAEAKRAHIDKWFIDGVQNTSLVNIMGDEITIPSSMMDDKKTLTIKVQCVETNTYDVMTLYKVSDGDSAYTVVLTSSRGELFKEDTTTTVKCTVYYGANVIVGKKYYWTMIVNNDDENPRTVETVTNEIEVNVNSTNILTTVKCQVEI